MNDPLGLFEETGNSDPLGLFEEAPKKKTSVAEDLKIGYANVGNTVDKAWSGLAGGLANIFDIDEADKIYRNLEERVASRNQFANPENKEQNLLGKGISVVSSLPSQVLTLGLSPFDTSQTMVSNGETMPRALAGAGIDTVGNAIGLGLGGVGSTPIKKALSAFGINALQDVLTRQGIASVAEQQATKEELGPSVDSAIISGVVGGAGALAARPKAKGVEPNVKLPEPGADPLGLFYPEAYGKIEGATPAERQANVARAIAKLEAEQKPGVQEGLPFSDSVESVAARQAEQTPQMDMFVDVERPRDAEAQAKQEALDAPVDRPDPTQVQQEMDAMWGQREEQVAAERVEQARAAKEDMLMKMEEELRSNAYTSPDFQSVRERRGRVPRKQAGRLLVGDELETIKNKFQKFAVEVEPIKLGDNNSVMVRLKTPDGKLSGFVDFAVREDGTLVAENAQVSDGLRGHGAAARMYMAAREAGFDIAPGRVQTDLGKRMVASLQRKGIINKEAVGQRFDAGDLNLVPLAGEQLPGAAYGAQQRYIPRSQRGGVNFTAVSDAVGKLFSGRVQRNTKQPVREIIGKSLIPVDPVPADVVKTALAEGKDTSTWDATKYTESGATLAAMTRKSALVDGVKTLVQNANKRADLLVSKTVAPVRHQLRKLSTQQLVNLGEVFKKEMFGRELYTTEQLQKAGLSEKELALYADMRQMFHDTMDIQNQARERLGLEPISAKEYYFSSRWQGDFRQPVYDAKGNLVWYLAANSKLGLTQQAKALKAKFPDLVVDPKKGHTVKSGMSKNDLQTQYSTLLDVLGRDNPEVQRLKEAMEDAVAVDASNTVGQSKHFERKGNIRGFVGDRPGMDTKAEALAMFQEQIQYAQNAYKWASMQEAGAKLKGIFSDEALNAQQPKNMEYAKQYFQDNAGSGTAKWVSGIENAVRDLGVSPSVFGKAVGNLKSFFITQKLGMSLGYSMANMMQITSTIPHAIDAMVKEGANPLKGFAVGMPTGLAMAAGHYGQALGLIKDTVPAKDMGFYKEAFKYAEDNGVTARSIYDESPITSRGPASAAMKGLGLTMTIPETAVRSMAFMSYVAMLKDTKKYKGNNMALFQKAEDLVNASMVDYRGGERPMMFSKLGTVGDALNTLQTYPINLLNQYRYFGKEALKGNFLPLVAMMATQGAMGGLMAVPGFNDMDKLWGMLKDYLPDEQWEKVKDFDPKIWALENLGEDAVYGLVSTASGVSMTNRLAAPGLADMAVSPAAPITDVLKQAGSVAQAVADPGNETRVAQAVRNVTPTGLQGLMETEVFRDQNAIDRPDGTTLYKKASDLADRQGQYARTPEEETMRKLGLRSQKEVLTSDLNYRVGKQAKDVEDRSKGITEKFYDALRRGDTKRMENLQSLYVRLNGKAIENSQIEAQIKEEYLTALERAQTTAKKLEAVKGMARLTKMVEQRHAD
jgi:hypothetical protein